MLTYDAATGTMISAGGDTVASLVYEISLDRMSYDKAALTKEYTFKHTIEIDGQAYTLTSLSRFEDKVSIAEVYAGFAELEKYADDRVVNAVLDAVK